MSKFLEKPEFVDDRLKPSRYRAGEIVYTDSGEKLLIVKIKLIPYEHEDKEGGSWRGFWWSYTVLWPDGGTSNHYEAELNGINPKIWQCALDKWDGFYYGIREMGDSSKKDPI